MPGVYLASLIALAIAATPARASDAGALLALTGPVPGRGVEGTALGALDTLPSHGVLESTQAVLAPAPETVVRQTRSFGSVTIDHKAHLARRSACKACHGPGPVTKLEFTPKIAHERCLGCHREQQRGPMKCRECHSVPEKPAEPAVQVAAGSGPREAGAAKQGGAMTVALATSAGSAPSAPARASSAGLSAPPAPGGVAMQSALHPADIETVSGGGFTRVLGLGYALSAASGRDASSGPTFAFTARQANLMLLLGIERGDGTVGMLGAGAVVPLRRQWNIFAVGLAGFDAPEKPAVSMMPAVGARAGVEWLGPRTSVALALTCVADLTRPTTAVNEQVGGVSASVGLSAGFVLGESR